MIRRCAKRIMGSIEAQRNLEETTVTRLQPHLGIHLVNLLVRWLQARYARKLEHYAAAHKSMYV
jgi:hypothetical protein